MGINLNGHGLVMNAGGGNAVPAITEFNGNIILSDTDETGTSAVKNIVVLSQASYDALTPDSTTLYFIT